MIRIGYQGEICSNSEEAAHEFAKRTFPDKECEFLPLVESRYVVNELKAGGIDYGVMATRNSLTGTVRETYDAIKDEYLEFCGTVILPIHHCVFIKPSANISDVNIITSHIQALNQTTFNRKRLYPGWKPIETNDTASAARNLANNVFSDNTAVICRRNAGEMYGLKLISENIEDDTTNRTEFRVYKKSLMDYSECNKPSFGEWLLYQFISEKGVSLIAKLVITAGILIALLLINKLSSNPWDISFTIGGYTAMIIAYLTSSSFRNIRKYRSLEGYWKYFPVSSIDLDGNEQKFTTPRIVRIYEEDGELKISGAICDKENIPMFESKAGETFVSSFGKKSGRLFYAYESPSSSRRTPIKGMAYLKWRSKYMSAKINIMRGIYYGSLTEDQGSLTYLRISKEEYDKHRTSMFL